MKQLAPTFPVLVQDFFLKHLGSQKGASPRTVESYRDTFRLLLAYARKRLKKPAVEIVLTISTHPSCSIFSDISKKDRGNSDRTRDG